MDAAPSPDLALLGSLPVKELKSIIVSRGGSIEGIVEKQHLVELAASLLRLQPQPQQQSGNRQTAPQIVVDVFEKGDAALLNAAAGIDPKFLFDQGTGWACGKVFRKGELAYHCKTCQHDDTCVMCKPCFDNSNHEGHEWSHYITSPGGMCDCGDFEAWAKEGCCPDHSQPRVSDPITLLPPATVPLARSVMRGAVDKLLRVCLDVAVSFDRALPRTKFPGEANDAFTVVLHNDDVHTFREVEHALSRARSAGLTSQQVKEYTDLINRQGRAAIKTLSGLEEARTVAADLRPAGLIMSIAKRGQLESEKAAVHVVQWLCATVEKSPGFIRMLLQELLRPVESDVLVNSARPWMQGLVGGAPLSWSSADKSALGNIVFMHALLPKLLALRLNDLFVKCLKDDLFKIELGCAVGRALPDLHALYAAGLGVREESIHNLSVQLFTTASVVEEFARRHPNPLLRYALAGLENAYKIACNRSGQVHPLDRQLAFLHHMALGGDDDDPDELDDDDEDDNGGAGGGDGGALMNAPGFMAGFGVNQLQELAQMFAPVFGEAGGAGGGGGDIAAVPLPNDDANVEAAENTDVSDSEDMDDELAIASMPDDMYTTAEDAMHAEDGASESDALIGIPGINTSPAYIAPLLAPQQPLVNPQESDDDDDDDDDIVVEHVGSDDAPPAQVKLPVVSPHQPKLELKVDPLHRFIYHRRFVHAQLDFEYILDKNPSALMWEDVPGKLLLSRALNVVGMVHGLDAHSRHQGMEHIPRQRPGWEEALVLDEHVSRELVQPIAEALSCLVDTENAFEPELVAEWVAQEIKSVEGTKTFEEVTAWLEGQSAQVFSGSILLGKVSVSFHLPLHRILGTFLNLLPPQVSMGELKPQLAKDLLDAPLRIWACLAQERVGLWRRDGDPIVTFARAYQMRSMRMLEADLLVMQVIANALHPIDFVALAAHRFGVVEWMQRIAPSHGLLKGHIKSNESDAVHLQLMEEFVWFLIVLTSYLPSSLEDKVRTHVVHILAASPTAEPFSKIMEECESLDDDVSEQMVESALKQVADAQGSSWVLKPKSWALVDVCFAYLMRSSQESVLERREKAVPQPRPSGPPAPRGSAVFPRAAAFRESRAVLLGVVRPVLLDAEKANSRFSPRLLGLAVHLLCLIVHDVSDDAWDLLKEQNPSIVELCVELSRKQALQGGFVWLMERFAEKDSVLIARLMPGLDKASSQDGPATMGKKRRAEAAQRAAMDRMRASQRSAAQTMRFDSDSDDDFGGGGGRGKSGAGGSASEEEESRPVCAICREEGVAHDLGYVAFAHLTPDVRPPAVATNPPHPPLGWVYKQSTSAPPQERDGEEWGMVASQSGPLLQAPPPFAPVTASNDAHLCIRFCGHALHSECKTSYLRMLASSGYQQAQVAPGELLCPLCKTVSNVWVNCKSETLDWTVPEEDKKRWDMRLLDRLASLPKPHSVDQETLSALYAAARKSGPGEVSRQHEIPALVAGFAKSLGRCVEAALSKPAGQENAYAELKKVADKKEWLSMLALLRVSLPGQYPKEIAQFRQDMQRLLHAGINPSFVPWLCKSGFVLGVDPFVMLAALLVVSDSPQFALALAVLVATRGSFLPDAPRLLSFLQKALVLVLMTTPRNLHPAGDIECNDADVLWTVLGLGSSMSLPQPLLDMIAAWQAFPVMKPVPQQLISLQVRYDEVFASVMSRAYCFSNRKPIGPPAQTALCLLCGEVLCGGSDCCRYRERGLCTLHAAACSKGTGIFLLIQRCELVLMYNDLSVWYPAPYVDARGETDVGLRRGHPLHLDAKAMDDLQSMFLDGALPSRVMAIRSGLQHVIRPGFY